MTIGTATASSPEARRGRAVVRTKPALYLNMTAHDHLHLAAAQAGVDPGSLFARAEAYGLTPWLHHGAQALSTGNARKLWLLICTPAPRAVMALDEPFDGLDAEGIVVLRSEIETWSRDSLVVVVAHQPPGGMHFDTVVSLSAAAGEPVDGSVGTAPVGAGATP